MYGILQSCVEDCAEQLVLSCAVPNRLCTTASVLIARSVCLYSPTLQVVLLHAQDAGTTVCERQGGDIYCMCRTPATLPETVTAAGGRVTDVFMGIDVYGRGSYGGGGHNVDVALRAVADAGLSAALFAPGWVFENLDRTQFVRLQEQWWNKVGQVAL